MRSNVAHMIPIEEVQYGPSRLLKDLIQKRDEGFQQFTPHQREVIERSRISRQEINDLFGKARELAGV